jgi:hypothetical protein
MAKRGATHQFYRIAVLSPQVTSNGQQDEGGAKLEDGVGGTVVDALLEKLDAKLREWKPETAAQVRQCVAEVIDLADQEVLDLMRSRAAEQEVLDLLDEPTSR